jgi:hypothetical protein
MFTTLDKAGSTKYMLLDANGPDGKDGEGWKILTMPPGNSGHFIIEHHRMYTHVLKKVEEARAMDNENGG